MNFDLAPILPNVSPTLLPVGPQTPAPAEEFAALLELGAFSGNPTAAGSGRVAETAKGADSAAPAPNGVAARDQAIVQADALVSVLTPQAEPEKAPEEAVTTLSAAAATSPVARPSARRPAPLPSETAEDETNDDSALDDRGDKADGQPSLPVAVPVAAAPITPVPVQAAPALEPFERAPAPVSPAGSNSTAETESALERAMLPNKAAELESADDQELPERLDVPEPVIAKTAQPALAAGDEPTQRPESAWRFAEAISADVAEEVAQTPSESARPVTRAPKAIGVEALPAIDDTPARPLESEQFVRATTQKSAPALGEKGAKIETAMPDISPASVSAPAVKLAPDGPTTVSAPVGVATAALQPVDMIIDRQLDLVRNERWLGELAQDIARTTDNNDRLSFRLMPDRLGRLDVAVSRSEHGLSLTIRTESDSAQSILTAAQPRLTDELRAHGVRLADTQMLSGDARHSHHHNGTTRPVPLIEASTTPSETIDVPKQAQRDGLYA